MFRFDKQYEVKKMGDGLMDHIVFNEHSPYPGLEIQYGKVQFIEEDDQLRLKFEFEIFSNPGKYVSYSYKLNEYLGKVLHEILMQELTYVEAVKEKNGI